MKLLLVCLILVICQAKCMTNDFYRKMLDERFLMENKLTKLEAGVREIEDVERIAEDRIAFLKQQIRYAITKSTINGLKKQLQMARNRLVSAKIQKESVMNRLRKTILSIPQHARDEIIRNTHLEMRVKQFMDPLENVDKVVDSIVNKEVK